MCCLPNKIIIIAAVSKNGVIGKNGQMPWHSKEELQFFKETTLGNPVVMGRKTFETIGALLIGRENIILSRKKNTKFPENSVRFNSIKEAIEYCTKRKKEKCFIIGGGEIFRQAFSFADRLIISEMNFECSGDVFFPKIGKKKWNLVESKSYNKFNVNYYTKVKF